MMNETQTSRWRLLAAAGVSAILVVALVHAESDGTGASAGKFAFVDEIQRGYEVVPQGVQLKLAGTNRALVGLGSYVVNTSGCNDCHTHPSYTPNGDPFQGFPEMINYQQYLTGGRQFGPVTSANLTPDGTGKPAGLTRDEFIQTLRTGHNPHDPPGEILQVMPWPVYGKKTDLELSAIYEYLSALPSLPDNPSPGP